MKVRQRETSHTFRSVRRPQDVTSLLLDFCIPWVSKLISRQTLLTSNIYFVLTDMNLKEIHEAVLFCKPLPSRTTAEIFFESLHAFMVSSDIDWTKGIGRSTDRAQTVVGRRWWQLSTSAHTERHWLQRPSCRVKDRLRWSSESSEFHQESSTTVTPVFRDEERAPPASQLLLREARCSLDSSNYAANSEHFSSTLGLTCQTDLVTSSGSVSSPAIWLKYLKKNILAKKSCDHKDRGHTSKAPATGETGPTEQLPVLW